MNIEQIAKAIEDDAGQPIDGLRESLIEMQNNEIGRDYSPEQLLVRSARQSLNLSQTKFAELISTPVATLRDWEQGRFKPAGSVIVLCKITLHDPDVLLAVS